MLNELKDMLTCHTYQQDKDYFIVKVLSTDYLLLTKDLNN